MNFSDYDYDNRHYSDPLFPPDLFSVSQVVLGSTGLMLISS